ncbi:MAG: hypothetical protein AAF734_00045 [Bacteroidota bacterium]
MKRVLEFLKNEQGKLALTILVNFTLQVALKAFMSYHKKYGIWELSFEGFTIGIASIFLLTAQIATVLLILSLAYLAIRAYKESVQQTAQESADQSTEQAAKDKLPNNKLTNKNKQ